jgi:hypothetical protein
MSIDLHEYSYALYLAYEFYLHPYDSMISNMVSERYPRDEDEDLASAYGFENCEEDESDDVAILDTQDLESSTSPDSILCGSMNHQEMRLNSYQLTKHNKKKG